MGAVPLSKSLSGATAELSNSAPTKCHEADEVQDEAGGIGVVALTASRAPIGRNGLRGPCGAAFVTNIQMPKNTNR